MSSRVTRTLLKLYPRTIRDRYGQELLELDDELKDHGDASCWRLIGDMLTGALLIRRIRLRAGVALGVVLVVAGVFLTTLITGHTAGPRRNPGHPRVLVAAQATPVAPPLYRTCPVAAGSSCASMPCTEFIAGSAPDTAPAADMPTVTAAQRTQPNAPHRILGSRCPTQPHPKTPKIIGGIQPR